MVAKNRQNNDLLLKFQKDQKMRGFGHIKGLFKILRAPGKLESCPLAILAGGKDRKRIILKKKFAGVVLSRVANPCEIHTKTRVSEKTVSA